MSEMEDAGNDDNSALVAVDQEPEMISWRDTEACEAKGISLGWGEYYIIDQQTGDFGGEDDEDSFASEYEEAEEVPDDEVAEEEERAKRDAADHDSRVFVYELPREDTAGDNAATIPSLVGMPDTLLEKIVNYATERPSQVCTLERVCKRFRRLTLDDEFWARYHRHPSGQVTKFGPAKWPNARVWPDDGDSHTLHWDGTRESSLVNGTIENIIESQRGGRNEMLDVLGGADAFRDVAADLVSQMIHEGSQVSFRLRGDSVGYLAEFLEEYMVRKLENAVLFAIHSHSIIVQGKDMKAALCEMDVRRLWETKQQPVPGTSPENQLKRCNVGTDEHGSFGPHRSSCQLLSLSGKVWRWPGDACRSVLPPEAGRRIIRRIALRAGIPKMSNEAFLLAEEDFLHTMGVLLVDAIESSIEMGESASYLDDDDSLVYGAPKISSPDMFEIPPPPLCVPAGEKEESATVGTEFIYTIVPGLVRASAERRDILPRHVYGDTWVPSSGFTSEEEKMIEESYYYDSPYEGSSDDEYDGIIEEVQIEESPIILDEVDEGRGEACDESSDGAYTEGSESQGSEMDFDITAEDVDWEDCRARPQIR